NRVRLDGAGTLEGKPAQPTLVSDGAEMQGGSPEKPFASATAPALGNAVLFGVTRMGILHDLVGLERGAPPDGADGSIDRFARVADVRRGPPEWVGGVEADRYDFKVVVRERPRAEATVWVDRRSGLPLRRHQVVHFPEGDATVDEVYEEFSIGRPVDPHAFDVTPPPMEI
ncbi:MAG TPA: hypothetical protein VHB21_10900, partial [Minicystis sp.]|nr:hypothetical protein [Minicystis sp.]